MFAPDQMDTVRNAFDTSNPQWTKPERSAWGNNCFETAMVDVPGVGSVIGVRDSKNADGPQLYAAPGDLSLMAGLTPTIGTNVNFGINV